MTRLSDSMILPGVGISSNMGRRMSNPNYGGVMGWSPNPTQWINKTGYVRRNLIPIVLRAPAGFAYLPNPDDWYAATRAIFETHPISIEGLNSTLTVAASDTPYGGAGEQFQDPTNVTRERTSPSFTLPDLYGAPVNAYLESWIQYLIMDPETKTALVNTLGSQIPPDMMADIYTMDMLFIEPDPQQSSVIRAWIVYNMFPLSGGEVQGRRDITTDMENMRYTVQMAGFAQIGTGVKAFAQSVLDGMRIAGANPFHRRTYLEGIDADILRAKTGWGNQLQELSDNQVVV